MSWFSQGESVDNAPDAGVADAARAEHRTLLQRTLRLLGIDIARKKYAYAEDPALWLHV